MKGCASISLAVEVTDIYFGAVSDMSRGALWEIWLVTTEQRKTQVPGDLFISFLILVVHEDVAPPPSLEFIPGLARLGVRILAAPAPPPPGYSPQELCGTRLLLYTPGLRGATSDHCSCSSHGTSLLLDHPPFRNVDLRCPSTSAALPLAHRHRHLTST